MRWTLLATLGFSLALPVADAAESPGPSAIAPSTPIAAPKDRAFGGEIRLDIDASDLGRRIVHVRESLSGIDRNTVLLYPKWLPGDHAPTGPIDRLAVLRVSANGIAVGWARDPVDMFAFRLHPAPGVTAVEIEFDYLSPTSRAVGKLEISRDVMMIDWNELVLYPAGYFTRRIPVQASLTLPQGWQSATPLEILSTEGARASYKSTTLETLIDSPVYAGRHAARYDLDSGATPVRLNLFADRPELLSTKPEQLQAYRALVQQAYALFGSHHFGHYDFLYSLSDQIQNHGMEHQQCSEDGSPPEVFVKWDQYAYDRELLPHEFAHSWNGKFRRPADLWTPNYNVPMQNSLLWVYEGQTQYWGQVLAARSGLWSQTQALDQLADTAAYYEHQAGRRWRPVEDTTKDEIINPRRPMSWPSWQRFEDYYEEGKLIWLDADTLIRERSQGKRSLDDFARAFVGIDDGSVTPSTYTFDDVVKALNAVEAYDWATFLRTRIDSLAPQAPLEGIRRGGYKLVYTDKPAEITKGHDEALKRVSLQYSIGVEIDDNDSGNEGKLREVFWDSPAFKAKLTEGSRILAVNGIEYSADVLKDAIRSAVGTAAPIELIVKTGERYTVTKLDYHDGLRYPHLERDGSAAASLDQILTAR